MTETDIYHAWRALEAVSRSRMDNMDQLAAAVAPAMSILEIDLNGLGFSIVDRLLVPTPAAGEEGFSGDFLRALSEADRINTLPAEPGMEPLPAPPPEEVKAEAASSGGGGILKRRHDAKH